MNLTKFISRADLTNSRIDRDNNVIKGVSLVSLGEARGHKKFADQKTLEQVRDCAKKYKSGLRVRFNPTTFNHGDASVAGFIPSDTIEIKDGKVVGDLHVFNNFHGKDYLYEMAERAPGIFGLSIEFNGIPEEIDGENFARCEEIFAATVVDLPAANPTGLFAEKKPYGDVEYADPGYQKDKQHRYPIDTEAHVRAAWSYINQGDNAGQYSADDLTKVKNKIKSAAKKFGIKISEESMVMELTKENLTAIGAAVAEAMKPLFTKFRMDNDNEDDSPPTQDEMDAAGCTDDMTDEEKNAAVMQWRAKAGNEPITKRDLLQIFRFTGGRPTRASGEVTKDDKDKATGNSDFESMVIKYRQTGMSDAKATLRAREDNPKGYNEWCQKGRPDIKDQTKGK